MFDYDVTTNGSTLLKENEVPGGFDRKNYVSERVFATASDGTKIPVSLFYRKDLENKADAPLYLYGYGSYGYVAAGDVQRGAAAAGGPWADCGAGAHSRRRRVG